MRRIVYGLIARSPAERSVFRARACLEARSTPHVTTAAELLFALEEPLLAEQLIGDRASELDGRNYPPLRRAHGRKTSFWQWLGDA